MSLGNRIRETRERFNYTQEELARKSGISRVSIGNYERGARIPSSTVLKSIASALYTNPDYLLGDSNYIDSDDKTYDLYEKYLPDYGYDPYLEEFLEKRGYIIEPSIYDFSTEEEQLVKADEWMDPDKQYFNIIHDGIKIKVSPEDAATLEKNILYAIDYEWYKLKQKYSN